MSFKQISDDDEHNSVYDVNDLLVENGGDMFHAQIAVICGSTYATGSFGRSLRRSAWRLDWSNEMFKKFEEFEPSGP